MRLNITTTAHCTANCVYCPQDQYRAAMTDRPAYLSREEFTSLLPRLDDPHYENFSFGGFSEPFENPDMVDLLGLAAEQDNVDGVSVYSNGEHLTPEVVRAIRHIPLTLVDISCHGFDERTYRRTRPFLDAAKVRENLLFLLQNRDNIAQLVISVTGPFGSVELIAELQMLCEGHGAEFVRRDLHSRAGLMRIGRARESPKAGPFRCAKFDFEKPILLPGGDLSLCCQDFSVQYVMGNLHRQTFGEIMRHSPLRNHILSVAAGRREDPTLHCYRCLFCVPTAPLAQC